MEQNTNQPVNTLTANLDSGQQAATWNAMASQNATPEMPNNYINPEFAEPKGKWNKKLLIIIAVSGVFVISIAGAILFYFNNKNNEESDMSQENAPVAGVDVEQTEPETQPEATITPTENDDSTPDQDSSELDEDGIINEMNSDMDGFANPESNVQGDKDVSFDTIDLEMQQVKGL